MTDILDLIDGALRDAATSKDAMRRPSATLSPRHCRITRPDGTVLYEGPGPGSWAEKVTDASPVSIDPARVIHVRRIA